MNGDTTPYAAYIDVRDGSWWATPIDDRGQPLGEAADLHVPHNPAGAKPFGTAMHALGTNRVHWEHGQVERPPPARPYTSGDGAAELALLAHFQRREQTPPPAPSFTDTARLVIGIIGDLRTLLSPEGGGWHTDGPNPAQQTPSLIVARQHLHAAAAALQTATTAPQPRACAVCGGTTCASSCEANETRLAAQ